MLYFVIVVPAVGIGFLAGMATLRRSARWCPQCGSITRCVECPGRPAPHEILAADRRERVIRRARRRPTWTRFPGLALRSAMTAASGHRSKDATS